MTVIYTQLAGKLQPERMNTSVSFPGSHGKMLSQFSRHLDELPIVRLHPIHT